MKAKIIVAGVGCLLLLLLGLHHSSVSRRIEQLDQRLTRYALQSTAEMMQERQQLQRSIQPEVNNRQEVIQRTVKAYVKTGQQEYTKGYYKESEKAFMMAQRYSTYLTRDERVELNSLLVKAIKAQRKG